MFFSKGIDTDKMLKILNYNINWPVCNYPEGSRRLLPKKQVSIDKLLMVLDNWSVYPEVAIDGVNGSGKSELTKCMRRTYYKINEYMPAITAGSEYNYNVFKSLQYLAWQTEVQATNAVWDRCAYSNLIFYFVHYLMHHYKSVRMPSNYNEVLPVLNQMAIDHNLLATLSYFKAQKHIPTLFIVCRNLNIIGRSLFQRNTINDTWNSKEHNYQMGQYHAYTYFGSILNFPVFDIMDFWEHKLTLGDMQSLIAAKIDIAKKEPSQIHLPDSQSTHEFLKELGSLNGNTLLFTHSRK